MAWGKRAWQWDARRDAAYEEKRRDLAWQEMCQRWEDENEKVKVAREMCAAESRALRKERRAEEARQRIAAQLDGEGQGVRALV